MHNIQNSTLRKNKQKTTKNTTTSVSFLPQHIEACNLHQRLDLFEARKIILTQPGHSK